jgi:RNA polymerase sigma-70 factor, ECF subfamily
MTSQRRVEDQHGEYALVERLQAGDEKAFVELVQRYQAQMVNVALSFVGTRAVAEEVVQDAWLGVVRGIERFAGRSSLRTWLFHIVANRARSAGAKEHRYTGPPAPEPLEDPSRFSADGSWAAPLPHWSEDVDDRLAAQSLTALVHQAIATLPPAQCQVVMLRDVNGLSSAEVCELLSLSEAHQRVLLHRGRVAVRRMIEAWKAKG